MGASAKRLLSLIQKSGLSYGALSERTGIPKSAIQRYATGDTDKIPAERAELLARELGSSASWILGLTDDTLRTYGYHITQTPNDQVRIIDESEPEKYIDLPRTTYEEIMAKGTFDAEIIKLFSQIKKPTLGQEGELEEVAALFNSLSESQKEQAKSYLRFLKASEEKK